MAEKKKASIMIFHDELCQVFNGLMTALSQGICPCRRIMLLMLHMEGARLLACPLNKSVFEFADDDFVEGGVLADPETYYTEIVMKADMNLVF